MGAIDSAVKSEIVRLAKKEARKLAVPIREEIKRLKKRNLELRSAIAAVDSRAANLHAINCLQEATSKAASGQVAGRLSPRLIKNLRVKLGLSQGKFSKLLGVSIGSVVNWEAGKMKPRPGMRAKILTFRGMGRREVKVILDLIVQVIRPKTPDNKIPKSRKDGASTANMKSDAKKSGLARKRYGKKRAGNKVLA